MSADVPQTTIAAFARTIHQEAKKYGFGRLDIIRLINALMDASGDLDRRADHDDRAELSYQDAAFSTDGFPLTSPRLRIRRAAADTDAKLLEAWLNDEYGRHFLLSCSAAQQHDIAVMLSNPNNAIGVVELQDGTAIGAVAFLDIDPSQRRAELRKLIGAQSARGKGYAEEATALWISYGAKQLGLEKIYVSTLQTHIRNIKLNESVGFRVEGILRSEVRFGNTRHDVLRMGLELPSRPDE